MAECSSEKELNVFSDLPGAGDAAGYTGDLFPLRTDALTGGSDRSRFLYYQLWSSMQRADGIDIIVSFLMESGVKMLVSGLENALQRGAKVRILTGNYLGITQPSALYLLRHRLGKKD